MSQRQSPLNKLFSKKDIYQTANPSKLHWTTHIKDCTVAARSSQPFLDLPVWGGCDYGKFCHLGILNQEDISYWSGAALQDNDLLLEVQGHEVSGYTLIDLRKLIRLFSSNSEPIVLKTLSPVYLPFADDLRQFLASSFPQDSPDNALQIVVKNNLNQRVVPCTTRQKRADEVDGVDYQFLSKEEFERREKAGLLLESGSYEGNRYGTPMPSHDTSILPGDITSGEALNQVNLKKPTEETFTLETVSDPNPHLGPLPPLWEIAYTDEGQVYFINHAKGSTQWEDPRMPSFDNSASEDTTGTDVDAVLPMHPHLDPGSDNRQEYNIPDGSSEDLPPGWERVVDPKYGVFYIDHINQHTQYEKPTVNGMVADYYPQFTSDPNQLKGRLVKTKLIKSPRGFGFTIIGGSDRECPQFLQIKNIVSDGPAAIDGRLKCGDVLVYVNDLCVLGFTHSDVVQLFQKISVGETVELTMSQGYRLPYEPNDPHMQFVTTMAVQSLDEKFVPIESGGLTNYDNETALSHFSPDNAKSHPMGFTHVTNPMVGLQSPGHSSTDTGSGGGGGGGLPTISSSAYNFFPREQKLEFLKVNILKSNKGFGFTIADNLQGQKVKQILDSQRCVNLRQGDVLVEINDRRVKEMPHSDVVQILKDCPIGVEARLLIQRGGSLLNFGPYSGSAPNSTGLSAVNNIAKTSGELVAPLTVEAVTSHTNHSSALLSASKSMEWLQQRDILNEGIFSTNLQPVSEDRNFVNHELDDGSSSPSYAQPHKYRSKTPGPEWGRGRDSALLTDGFAGLRVTDARQNYSQAGDTSSWLREFSRRPKTPTADHIREWKGDKDILSSSTAPYLHQNGSSGTPNFIPTSAWLQKSGPQPHTYGSLPRPDRRRYNNTREEQNRRGLSIEPTYGTGTNLAAVNTDVRVMEFTVTLDRQSSGFGFRILGGAEERSQVTVGPLVPNGAAELSGQMRQGDEIISVDGTSVLLSPHRHVVGLMDLAGRVGRVTLGLRRRIYPSSAMPPSSLSQVNSAKLGPPGLTSSQSMYQLKPNLNSSYQNAATLVAAQQNHLLTKQRHSIPQTVYDVTLQRNSSEGFGFIIATSASSNKSDDRNGNRNSGEYIGRIIEGSPAHRCGLLRVGDRIIAVNGIDISRLAHEEVVRIIKECQSLTLRVLSSNPSGRNHVSQGGLPPPSSRHKSNRIYQNALPTVPTEMPLDLNISAGDEFVVTLTKGSRGFGFSIRGGQESSKSPLCVLKIAEDGAAKLDGRLRVGDQILQINGHSMKGMPHTKAIEIIQSGGSTIRLLVRRPHNSQSKSSHGFNGSIHSAITSSDKNAYYATVRKNEAV